MIKIFEAFAGIGAQHKAITNLKFKDHNFKIAKTSEWDARAIISYAQIHHQVKFKSELKKVKKWSEEKVNNYFKINELKFSLDSKKPSKITRKNFLFKVNLIAANLANNNLPDIHNVRGEDLKGIDLLFYSFPCQGLSIANMGRDKGIKNNDSTSHLIWQIKRILKEVKKSKSPFPKYLVLENVLNLISKKHLPDYQKWKRFLSKLGYRTRTLELNGLECSWLQNRKRVFGISILNWKPKINDKKFNTKFKIKYCCELKENDRKNKYNQIMNSSNGKDDEIMDAIPNNTKSRREIGNKNANLKKEKRNRNAKSWTFATLSTKQDRNPNIGMIPITQKKYLKEGKLDKRFVTTREAYLIMGFDNRDFNKVKIKYQENILTKASLYRQAGNSIIVSVLEAIFKFIDDFEKGKVKWDTGL